MSVGSYSDIHNLTRRVEVLESLVRMLAKELGRVETILANIREDQVMKDEYASWLKD